MRCFYCGAELKDMDIKCPECGKDVQLVPDYNILDDEFLNEMMEEKGGTEMTPVPIPEMEEYYEDTDEDLYQPSKKKNGKQERGQKRNLILITIMVILFVIAVIAAVVVLKINSGHSRSVDYQVAQAKKAVNEGNTQKAISYYEKAVSLDKKNVTNRVALADLYLEEKDYDSALILYQEALNLDPDSKEVYSGLIQLYAAQEKYDEIVALSSDVQDNEILAMFWKYLVTAPKFNYEAGTYETYLTVELSAVEDSCTIYYTLDGKDPMKYGDRYTEALVFDTEGTYTISAVCVNDKGVYSTVVTNKYVINIPAPDTPLVSPDGGTFASETYITISVPDNCTAYYTWDNTEPNVSSTKYTEPILIPVGSNILSVIIVDEKTQKISPMYQSVFNYYEG